MGLPGSAWAFVFLSSSFKLKKAYCCVRSIFKQFLTQDFIMGLIQDSGVLGHPTWTGGVLNDMGEWSWDDNSPWDYENWAAANGTESNGGDCMFLDDQGAWRAEDCAKKTADWNCICQKSL